jgi:hypothetical protein
LVLHEDSLAVHTDSISHYYNWLVEHDDSISVHTDSLADHLARLEYLDDSIAQHRVEIDTKLALTGGTMTGNINMGTNDISNADTITATTLTDGTASISGGNITTNGSILSSGNGGIGYSSGSSVIQNTSKSDTVTINAISGKITMHNASLDDKASVSFTVTNSSVSATDVPVIAISGGTTSAYHLSVTDVNDGNFEITITNVSGFSQSDFVEINFVIIKAAN